MSALPRRRQHWPRYLAACVLTLAMLRPASAHADNAGPHAAGRLVASSGEQVYRQICQGCHMPDGGGAAGAGRYPALAGNPTMASARYMALTVLGGRRNMPAFAPRGGDSDEFFVPPSLSDAQIAAVINYVRTHFGNHYTDRITPAQVIALHRQVR